MARVKRRSSHEPNPIQPIRPTRPLCCLLGVAVRFELIKNRRSFNYFESIQTLIRLGSSEVLRLTRPKDWCLMGPTLLAKNFGRLILGHFPYFEQFSDKKFRTKISDTALKHA